MPNEFDPVLQNKCSFVHDLRVKSSLARHMLHLFIYLVGNNSETHYWLARSLLSSWSIVGMDWILNCLFTRAETGFVLNPTEYRISCQIPDLVPDIWTNIQP